MKTLGIGMVGARYGARMHLANYARLPRDLVAIRGVCSRTKESGGALAREAQVAFVTDDYDSLLARKDIDVVDICVPPALHHEFAVRAADAGKHIIMEKPLTGYFGMAGDPEPIGSRVPRARMREGARNNAEAVREAVRRNRRAVLLRGKLDLRAADRKNAAADRGFQGLDPRTSRRRKPLGLKLGVFAGLEVNRRRRVAAHGRAFGRGVPAPETMGGSVAAGQRHPARVRARGHGRPDPQPALPSGPGRRERTSGSAPIRWMWKTGPTW